MENIEFEIPKGYVIDKSKSTEKKLVYVREKGAITDRIKTFDDACRELDITEKEFNEKFKKLELDKDTIAYEKLKIIIKALNEGWSPNWLDTSEKKWYPYFNLSSGFVFSVTICGYSYATSTVGSRLCLKSQELAQYAGTQFLEIYKDFLT